MADRTARALHYSWREVAARSELARILSNVGWLLADRALSLVFSSVVGILVVRHLGPEGYGLLSYAQGFAALFVPLVGLGLQDVAVRELVKGDLSPSDVLGTSFVLQVAAALGAFSLALGTGVLAEDTALPRVLIGLSLLPLLLRPLDVLVYWFVARTESKYRVWAQNVALICGAAARVVLVLRGVSVLGFAIAAVAESVVSCLALLVFARGRVPSVRSWSSSKRCAGYLMRAAWPLLLSGIAITVYMRVDTLMLRGISGAAEVGIYSAARKLSELWYFLPVALAASVFPTVIRSTALSDQAAIGRRVQVLYDLMAAIGYAVAVPVSVLSVWLVPMLLGEGYSGVDRVLSVHTWAFLFVALGVARNYWLVAAESVRYTMYSTGIGVIVNIGLNFLLIPRHGAYGAAWATLASQFASAYVSCLVWRTQRQSFTQMSRSLALPFRMRSAFQELFGLLRQSGL